MVKKNSNVNNCKKKVEKISVVWHMLLPIHILHRLGTEVLIQSHLCFWLNCIANASPGFYVQLHKLDGLASRTSEFEPSHVPLNLST